MGEAMTDESPKVLHLARSLYEASRKRVSGRPPWDRLNPKDAYDMGMRGTAIRAARIQLGELPDQGF